MELIFILLAISVPVFYLVGLIEVLKTIFKKDSSEVEPKYEKIDNLLFEEISKALDHGDIAKAKRILAAKGFVDKKGLPTADFKISGSVKAPSFSWIENWYSDNSIDALLYLGAFLIIVSAGTFVGFNWQSFTGETKALILGLFTAAFFGSGFYIYLFTKKVKRAGLTFIGIGSLLVPFNGWAWYNFVLKPAVEPEVVWFFTSLIGVVIWTFLAVFIKRKFFLYLVGAGFLSTAESLAAISHLGFEYYLFAGVCSGFVLLLARQIAKSEKMVEDFEETLMQMGYASITVGIMASFMVLVFEGHGSFFTGFMTVNLFLTALFFRVVHFLDTSANKPLNMFVSQIFGTFGVFSFVQAANIDLVWTLYIFAGLAVLYIALAYLFKKVDLAVESERSSILSFLIAIVVYFTAIQSFEVDKVHSVVFGLLIVLVFWNIFYLFGKNEILYLKNAAWFLVLWPFLKIVNAAEAVYPYYFIGVSIIIYLASFVVPTKQEISTSYRNSGLGFAFGYIVIFGFQSLMGDTGQLFQLNGILTGYFVSALFMLDSLRVKRHDVFAFGLGIFLGVLLWNFSYLDLENTQFYTLPISIYLFGLGYWLSTKRIEVSQIIEISAAGFLILPTFFQALDKNGFWYALLLGGEGVVLLLLGITFGKINYKYIGYSAIVLAVVSQTYEYLTSLPRWLITGVAGLAFLAVAIYLLASKKENK